jgi:hypothetical protein
MRRTTVGRLLVNKALPEDMRSEDTVLDAGGLKSLFNDLALRHPEQYSQVAKKLSDIGRDVAYTSGGFSFGLKHLRETPIARQTKERIRQQVEAIHDSDATEEDKRDRITSLVSKEMKPLESAIYSESLREDSPLAHQVLSGSRGKPLNLKSLRGADLLYRDHRDRLIPLPVLRSYAQGLTPAEYFAGSFGARAGIVDVKKATADSGFFAKRLAQATHRLLVTAHDDENNKFHFQRGLPVDTSDPDNEGALLSVPAGQYPRNTILTPKILKDLQAKGIAKLLVRSPLVGGPPEGGVYARDVGVREKGGLAPVGDQIGVTAASALSEPLTQSGLSSKHSGGVAGTTPSLSGFAYLDKLIEVPKVFPGGAAHSEVDGTVQRITDAPAGGKYVTVGDHQHYIAAGFSPKVKVGDSVEAGDVLSDGLPNPAKITEHKGVGEGRRYLMQAFRQAMKDSGLPVNRRNVEVVARGLVNHIRITEESGEHVPGDIYPYDFFEQSYELRHGSRKMSPREALGKYLEKPVLHHTIGTKIRPSMLKDLEDFGIRELHVHDEPPPFEPLMVRSMENISHDPDWSTRMLGSYLEKNTLRAVHTGAVSDPLGTSYVPALISPNTFGREGLMSSFDPKKILKE